MQTNSDTSIVDNAAVNLNNAFDSLVLKLGSWLEALVLLLPNFVVALLIVIAAALVARVARRIVQRLLLGITDRISHARGVVNLLSSVAYVAVLATGVFMALGVLQLDTVVTSLLAGAGIIGLALGFAFQDIASNFIAGILMAVRAPFQPGDLIESDDLKGIIQDVNLRATMLRTLTGQIVTVPNSQVFQNPIINYSRLGERRVDLEVGVGYGTDLEQAQRVAREALRTVPGILESRDADVFYTGFGDSPIDFMAYFWIPFVRQPDFLAARSEAIKRIKAAFDREGIVIPFPIRTLDFAPSGGIKLDEVMSPANGQSDG